MGVIAMKPFGGGIIKQASVTFTYFSQHPNVVPIYVCSVKASCASCWNWSSPAADGRLYEKADAPDD
jgi:hypothetical protein